jgi:hypothetical protein
VAVRTWNGMTLVKAIHPAAVKPSTTPAA